MLLTLTIRFPIVGGAMKRKTRSIPTRIYSYECGAPVVGADTVDAHMGAARWFKNKLLEIERRRRGRPARRARDVGRCPRGYPEKKIYAREEALFLRGVGRRQWPISPGPCQSAPSAAKRLVLARLWQALYRAS